MTIRRVLAPELELVTDWVRRKFQSRWSSETTIAMSRCPPTCFLASMEEGMIGFACYDTTARGFFGPTVVDEAERGKGIGHALLLTTLLDMKNMGYGYAIIGDVGPAASMRSVQHQFRSPDRVSIAGCLSELIEDWDNKRRIK